MHQRIKFILFLEWHSACFGRSFCPSLGIQDCTYSNWHLSNRYCCLLVNGYVSKQTAVSVWQMPVAVCTVLNSWWWMERPSETCRVSFQNKFDMLVHLVGFTIEMKSRCYSLNWEYFKPQDRNICILTDLLNNNKSPLLQGWGGDKNRISTRAWQGYMTE